MADDQELEKLKLKVRALELEAAQNKPPAPKSMTWGWWAWPLALIFLVTWCKNVTETKPRSPSQADQKRQEERAAAGQARCKEVIATCKSLVPAPTVIDTPQEEETRQARIDGCVKKAGCGWP